MTINTGKISLIKTSIDDDSEGAGWIVTFADTMSLLLAFFVLLISFSSFDTAEVSSSVAAMNQHLGGGSKKGNKIIKTNFNLAADTVDIAEEAFNVKLVEDVLAGDTDLKKIVDTKINNFNQMTVLKQMLKDNPALLGVLLDKKAAPKEKKDVTNSLHKKFNKAQIDLTLDNFKRYISTEGLDDFVFVQTSENGDLYFTFDCGVLFNVRTHVFLKDAFLILKRLESVFVLTPNQIAIENYFSQNLDYSAIDMSEKQLMLGRSSKIVDFFVSENDNISSDRFSFLLKGFEDEHWNKAQTINVSGEGIISIVLLSFKQ